MANTLEYDVFLSHSSKDKAVVRPLARRLRKDGLTVWFDEWVLKPGDSIPARVEEGLEHSRVLVLCMSANAFASEWAQLEAGTFRFRDPLNKDRRFIPLRLDEAPIKGSLAQFLYIKWPRTNHRREYAKLLEACRGGRTLTLVSQSSPGWREATNREIVRDSDTRDDFAQKVKDTLAKRVGFLCSNPACRCPTTGPHSDPDKIINVGVAAHITAAALGGPRYDPSLSQSDRASIRNGLWLCQNCAKLVDSDGKRFSAAQLLRWKEVAEQRAEHDVGTPIVPNPQSSSSSTSTGRPGRLLDVTVDPDDPHTPLATQVI